MPQSPEPLVVHGLDLSYFTGKLEAFLRAKGIRYRLHEMDTRDFAACARATGVRQMPQVECPDGGWLTDTTLILRHLEGLHPEPATTPGAPHLRFLARLLEDFGDESLWRPALYYRWAFADDAWLMSGRIAAGMLRDVPLPFFLRRLVIRARQRRLYLRGDGVTRATAPAIERLYLETLDAMEPALAEQPFLLGARPCEADFGFFGSMFRHFASDPTPARQMRERAPRTLSWVARLWALTPGDFAGAPAPAEPPETSRALIRLAAATHLPYLAANAAALARGERRVRFRDRGAEFATPPSPYRAWCLEALQQEWAALDSGERRRAAGWLGDDALARMLEEPRPPAPPPRVPRLPIRPGAPQRPADRSWRA
jgi:glutathione S-transferase